MNVNTIPGQPVPTQVFVQLPVNTLPNLNKQALLGLAITDILAAVAVIILEGIVFTLGEGVWTGCLVLTTGILGCAATKRPIQSVVTATTALAGISIAAAIISAVLLGITYCYYGSCYIWTGVQVSHIVFDVISIGANIGVVVVTAQALCSKQTPVGVQYAQPSAFGNQQWPQFQAYPQQAVLQQSYVSQYQAYPQQQQQLHPSMYAQPPMFSQQPSTGVAGN